MFLTGANCSRNGQLPQTVWQSRANSSFIEALALFEPLPL